MDGRYFSSRWLQEALSPPDFFAFFTNFSFFGDCWPLIAIISFVFWGAEDDFDEHVNDLQYIYSLKVGRIVDQAFFRGGGKRHSSK
ncbi:hypothetical protein IEQ34_014579 [Dendrobium chrysotoxum]|uniref:Uncharacterized protein n=1 Tax=Dendrobium chrysotoxum TaxID=161865 RepID=A0AAV7GKA5_DENCH|nr:hypothetical protein IEQ34_014579 [Dendrobium chrysotoxum]